MRSQAARRSWALARATIALLGLLGLGLIRPALPRLSGSLTSPITTNEVEQVVTCAAWVLAACLAVIVFIRAIRSVTPTARRVPGVLPSRGASATQRLSGGRARPSRYVLTVSAPLVEDRSTAPSPSSSLQAGAEKAALIEDDPRTISIAVLGPLAMDGLLGRIKRAATHELLAYLAFHPKGGSRDELIEAIWPTQDPKRTRPRFWQSVTEARKALGDAWVHHGERYELDRSKVRVDLDDLDRLLTTSSDTSDDPTALESALALWRGEPLEGSDYLWAEGELRVLHATLVDLLERVGRSRLGRDDARGALQMADQAIALDGLHEPSWRLALQAEHALGLRESIARRYDELTRSLDEQLGLEPARETRVMYRQLLGQS